MIVVSLETFDTSSLLLCLGFNNATECMISSGLCMYDYKIRQDEVTGNYSIFLDTNGGIYIYMYTMIVMHNNTSFSLCHANFCFI